MFVLMLMSMLMSHASVGFFVLSFVLSCAYAYVTIVRTRLYILCEGDLQKRSVTL